MLIYESFNPYTSIIPCVKCFVKCFWVLLRGVDIKYSRAVVCGIQVVGAVLCGNVSYMVTGVCLEGCKWVD